MTESEIAIIGGGIAGASTAYHLAQAGRDVTLLERGAVASEASGINAGSIGALGWGRLPDLQAYLTMGSLEIFRSLQLDLGYDIEFRQSGALQAIQSEEQYEFARDQVLALRAEGYTVELLGTRDARSLEPEASASLLGAVHSPLRAQADPIKATTALARAAERLGARVLTGHTVAAIGLDRDGYRLTTADGTETTEHVARTLVIAAGAWSAAVGQMLGLRIPIVPVRGQMWATEPLPPRIYRVISSTESALAWHREPGGDTEGPPALTHRHDTRLTRHLYGRQTVSGEIIFGGDRQLVGFSGEPDPVGIELNRAHAAEVLPFLGELPVRRTWAGLMPFSLDGEPMIGRVPLRPHLYIVSGLASSGFGRGPMAGRLLAEYVHSGHRPAALAESDPARSVTELTEAISPARLAPIRRLDRSRPRPSPSSSGPRAPRTRPGRSGPGRHPR